VRTIGSGRRPWESKTDERAGGNRCRAEEIDQLRPGIERRKNIGREITQIKDEGGTETNKQRERINFALIPC
jgi:hypothetical protein